MTSNIRYLLHQKILDILQQKSLKNGNIAFPLHLQYDRTIGKFAYLLPTKAQSYNIENIVSDLINDRSEDIIENIMLKSDTIYFNLYKEKFIKHILENNFSFVSPPHIGSPRNIIVEFSSPNIAKPFHMGHLRSTMLGNYVSNINYFLKNQVKRINYLGDWGTQFGLIDLGINLAEISEKEIEDNPIEALYKAYISANKKAELDSKILDQARAIFRQLETGNAVVSDKWQRFRHYTIEELRRTYNRLGVTFDEYQWESMHKAENIQKLLHEMRQMKILKKGEDNKEIVDLHIKPVPILKSDGTTLYIARDIAAAIDRYNKNIFDKMYYVVDHSQAEHFCNLIMILEKMGMPWSNKLEHISFGRVVGMTTRKGNVTFLKDILDKTRDSVREIQKANSTTRASLDSSDTTADILGVSAIIINDFKYRRDKNYTFNWNSVFDIKGNTGIRLQYSHCRLVSLEQNSGATLVTECLPCLLNQPIIDDLIFVMGQFDEAVIKSYEELEPCILTKYLFDLSQSINRTWKALPVKGEPTDIASQRLLLFYTAKNILAQGMKLLGLTPLDKM
ncbi:probable arginine--tRNA ligase, mitochondrial [Prorops nasuta]|uniref:probable arginine--tRNA ligase, mitochondrial n=1 Tax=Prorops nasuta TaxID=863751 RepID=UPI0034CFEE2B